MDRHIHRPSDDTSKRASNDSRALSRSMTDDNTGNWDLLSPLSNAEKASPSQNPQLNISSECQSYHGCHHLMEAEGD